MRPRGSGGLVKGQPHQADRIHHFSQPAALGRRTRAGATTRLAEGLQRQYNGAISTAGAAITAF